MKFPSTMFQEDVLTSIVSMVSTLFGDVTGCSVQQLPPSPDCQSSFAVVRQTFWTLDLLFLRFQWRTRLHVLALIQIIEIQKGFEVKFVLVEDLAPLMDDIMHMMTLFYVANKITGLITVVIEQESESQLS